MDDVRFDEFTRGVALDGGTRRRLLQGAVAGILGLTGIGAAGEVADAKRCGKEGCCRKGDRYCSGGGRAYCCKRGVCCKVGGRRGCCRR